MTRINSITNQDLTVLKGILEGKTLQEIANSMGYRSIDSVYSRVRRMVDLKLLISPEKNKKRSYVVSKEGLVICEKYNVGTSAEREVMAKKLSERLVL